MQSGHDYVLVGRRAALKVPFARIAEDFEAALRRMHGGARRQNGIPMTDNKNTILAIVLSAHRADRLAIFLRHAAGKSAAGTAGGAAAARAKASAASTPAAGQQRRQRPAQPGAPPGSRPSRAAAGRARPSTRAAALAASPRVPIATDSLQGSIALKGGRIDDLALVKFRETVDPKSPPIVLLSPSGSPEPFYAEFGWTNAAGANVKVPDADTVWTAGRLRRARASRIRSR